MSYNKDSTPSSYHHLNELIAASCSGNTETLCSLLLSCGTNINASGDSGETPLTAAASWGKSETAALLLRHGADVKARDEDGETPLTAAASWGKTETVALLLRHGADVKARDEDGDTPLTAATSRGHSQTVSVLLAHGADSNATGAHGQTSLMIAASRGYYAVVDLLLANGAQKLGTDSNGKSAIYFAMEKYQYICADQLTEDKLYTSWAKALIGSNEIPVDAAILQDIQEVCKLIYADEAFHQSLILNWSNMGMHDVDLEEKLGGFSDNTQYKILLIDNNHLTFLPDLNKYPQLRALRILVTFNNKICGMRGFPPDLKAIFLRSNAIEVLESKCFQESIFDDLKNQLEKRGIDRNLKKPPQEVINLGLQAVLDYFKQGDFLLNYHNRMVVIGPSMDGKSSLVESLIAGKPRLVKEDDRTQVVAIRKWEVSETDVMYIFDQGGHDLYQITNPYFISPRSTVIISHQVCSEPDSSGNISSSLFNQEINKTMQFLRTTLHQHPENEIYIAVTKADKLTPSGDVLNLEDNTYSSEVRAAVNKEVQQEIENLDKILKKADDSYSNNVISMRDNFTSRLEGIKFFPVSSINYAGIDNFKQELHQKIKAESTEVPKVWIDTYHEMKADKKGFWTFSQFECCFSNHIKVKGKTCKTCLRYFNETGLVLWNEHHPHLKQYIFYDMDFLVAIFKSLFDHSLSLEHFESDDRVQEEFDDNEEFNEIVNLYQKEGLLKHQFLSFLLSSYNLSKENEVTIIEVIKLFHMCSEIVPKKDLKDLREQIYFVPWLVRDNQPPSVVNIQQPLYVDQQTITLVMRYQFFNSIPINIAEMFCVEIQKYSVENNYLGVRYAWHDGIQIFLGHAQIILFRMAEDQSIYLCIRGNPSHLCKLWKPFQYLHDAFEILLKPWRGVVRSRHSICAHCVLHGIDPPHHWMPKKVFPDKPFEPEARCPKGDDVIPSALITCLPQDAADAAEQVESVKTYLKKYYIPPQRKELVALTEQENDVFPPQNRSHGLHATPANSKLNPEQSRFVLDKIMPSICYIDIPGMSGTGFVIGALRDPGSRLTHRYVLTCYHMKLLPALRDKQNCIARFAAPTAFGVKIVQPVYWSEDMDYVLVKLEASQELDNSLPVSTVSLGVMVTVNDPKHSDALVLCAHTYEQKIDWGAYSVSMDEEKFKSDHGDLDKINMHRQCTYSAVTNEYIYPLSRKFTVYQCSCQEGCSGAPCFSVSQTRLFAMHCGSVYNSKLENSPEYGVLLKYVVQDIKTKITNPSSSTNYWNMPQGGLQLIDLESLFPNIPKGMDLMNEQESSMQ